MTDNQTTDDEDMDKILDEAIADSFPASDPISIFIPRMSRTKIEERIEWLTAD